MFNDCVQLIFYLLIDQWRILQTPQIKKNTFVSTDSNKKSTIKVNFNIVFKNTPCYLLDFNAGTAVN